MWGELRCVLNDCGAERFYQNELRQLLADSQARVADLADEIRMAGEQLDSLLLSEADFAQAILELRRGAQLLDPHRHARPDAAQGTKLTLGFLSEF